MKVGFCIHYQIHLLCASYLLKFIAFIYHCIFDKTVSVDSLKFHYCFFQNVNAFVESVHCTIS